MYADDTVIYYSDSDQVALMETLQTDLNNIVEWLEKGRLILNLSKTKYVLFGTYQRLGKVNDFNIKIGQNVLDKLPMFNYLGVTLDETKTWKEHVATVSEKVNKRLGMLGRIRGCLTLKAAQCVYNTILK